MKKSNWKKFKKKPIEIKAYQWFLKMGKTNEVKHAIDKGFSSYYVETLEGPLLVSPDDWIIKGIEGEIYPCKPNIFKKTYRAIGD